MKYTCWSDGSYENGVATVGYIIKNEQNECIDGGFKTFKPCMDSMEAEHFSLMFLLKKLKKLHIRTALIFNDCNDLITIINNNYSKNERLQKYANALYLFIEKNFHTHQTFEFQWISRKENYEAHWLSHKINLTRVLQLSENLKMQKEKMNQRLQSSKNKSLIKHPSHSQNLLSGPFIISKKVRDDYRSVCPTSYHKCKNKNEMNKNITHFIEQGHKKNLGKNKWAVYYHNFILFVENAIVISFQKKPNETHLNASNKRKRKWYNHKSKRKSSHYA